MIVKNFCLVNQWTDRQTDTIVIIQMLGLVLSGQSVYMVQLHPVASQHTLTISEYCGCI